MESTVETLSPTRVRLAIEVPFAELEPSLKKAYREIGAQVNIPGFRKGKVPNAIIDQRVGREVVLDEAKNEVIRTQTEQAIRDHRVRRLGPAEVEVTDFADGQSLKFTAELDVRPEITLPKLDDLEVSVDAITVTDEDVDTQLDGLRQRFATLKTVERAAQRGDFVQIDLAATVDGEEVPGGSATNLSHEIGSGQLLPGLDEAIEGLTAGAATTFQTELVAGDFKDRAAEVAVTLRSVREREMPNLDDEFAQLASEFDTLDELRADLATRLTRVKKVEQLYAARDQTLQALVAAAEVPAPEGVVREELSTRKEAMADQLQRMGISMEDFLASEGKTEAEVDADLTESASQSIRIQLLLDALAEAEQIQVSDDEFGHEVVHRAQRAGVAPQQYYDQLMRSGLALAVFGDVRRNKALAHVLERVSITDSNGERVSVEELRRAGGDDTAHDHDLGPLEPDDDHDHDDHDE
ncbi:MAG: trigger factor [Micromonosporaceae bacterium]